MSRGVRVARTIVAVLLVVLGLVIVGRGLVEGAPVTFTLMGALMIILGLYRLRQLRSRVVRQ